MPEFVVIDNHDSFTYNLVDYLEHHVDVRVVTNDRPPSAVTEIEPDGILISPGPGSPANPTDAGCCLEVLTTVSQTVPTFGVCFGLEAAVYAYGGSIERADTPVHGEASSIVHDGEGVFDGLPRTFRAGRYHSLIPGTIPEGFEVTATTEDGLPMGIRHRRYPIECVLFHPESVLTPVGRELMGNVAAMATAGDRPEVAR